jgi:signal recognition particle subunit SRP54
VQEVNALVDKFSAAQKMMKQMRNGGGAPAGMALPPGVPGMPGMTGMAGMAKKPSTPPKKKSRSGNPAKRAVEENS